MRQGTGLSVALLSTNFGYRVTYEDMHGSVRQLSYSNTTKGVVTYVCDEQKILVLRFHTPCTDFRCQWADGVLVKNGTAGKSSALATTYLPSPNDTVPAQQTIYQVANNQIFASINKNSTFINQTSSWNQGMTQDHPEKAQVNCCQVLLFHLYQTGVLKVENSQQSFTILGPCCSTSIP